MPKRWIHTDAARTGDHPSGVRDLLDRRIAGITVDGVFSPEEIAAALPALERHPEIMFPTLFGRVASLPIGATPDDGSDERSTYLDATERCRAVYAEAFGIDPHRRLVDVLQPLAPGIALVPPEESGRSYNPGHVRWFEPGRPALPAHVGNEFPMHGRLAHVHRTSDTANHLSWFVVLQEPEAGGSLAVFDVVDGGYEAQGPWTHTGRDDRDFDELPATRIPPRAGTLVMFGGGWRWHKVDDIVGDRQRITYGGFASPTRDRSALYFWA